MVVALGLACRYVLNNDAPIPGDGVVVRNPDFAVRNLPFKAGVLYRAVSPAVHGRVGNKDRQYGAVAFRVGVFDQLQDRLSISHQTPAHHHGVVWPVVHPHDDRA